MSRTSFEGNVLDNDESFFFYTFTVVKNEEYTISPIHGNKRSAVSVDIMTPKNGFETWFLRDLPRDSSYS